MQVTEVFYSVQGEGRKAGLPTTFVRTTGCHLRCSWCDATYTFTGGTKRSLEDIMEEVRSHPTKEVCFTGGEPLLQKDAWDFLRMLLEEGYAIVMETAGNLDFSQANDLPHRDQLCVSMDIKCPSSGEHEKNTPEKMHDLRPSDQLKFVIADSLDYAYAKGILAEHGYPPCPVYFNPVGGTEPKDLCEWILAEPEPLPVHVGIQLHKLAWGDVPGR